jgi:nucleoside-diphosphate-sugar epimerase
MRVMILGGTGLAGEALLTYLGSHDPAAEATVVSRTATSLPGARGVISGHYGELAQTSTFNAMLPQFDAAVHLGDGLAVLQAQRHDAAGLALANGLIDASARLAMAVRDARVPLFIYVSSIKALCDEDDCRVLDEDAATRATTLYGLSKLKLEQTLGLVFGATQTRLVTLRTPVMYAEDGRGESLLRLLRVADTPYPLPLANVHNKRSVLCVRNLASAICAVLNPARERAPGVYHVHDGPALSTTKIVASFRDALVRPRRLFSLGSPVIFLAQRFAPVAGTARRLYGSLELCDARIRTSLRWTNPVETNVALRRMAESYVQEMGRRQRERLARQGDRG